PSSGMRPSHYLCLLVPSIPRSSAAIFDRPSDDSSSASPSRKRSRSPTASVPLSSPIPGALSSARADLLPSPKRIISPESATDLEVSSVEGSEPSRYRGTDLEMDDDVERSDGIDIDPEIQVEIDESIAYAGALRVRGIDARVVVEAVDREEIETCVRGLVEVRVGRVTHPVIANDIPEPDQEEGAIEVTYETLGDLLERDNMRLRDMMDVVSQRVTRSQRRELRVQREMRQIRRFRFYDRMRIARLKACARRHLGYPCYIITKLWHYHEVIMIMTMPNIRSGASRTREGINEQIDCRLAGALGAYDAAKNLEPLIGGGVEQEEENGNEGNGNGGNGNGGNGNGGKGNGGNGNGRGNGYNFEGFMPTRECTYQDFLKCQPLSFNRTEGFVGLTRWFEKMETVYCLRNEIQKMETELWNLAVKGNDLIAYTRRFRELVLLCTRMVLNEEDKVERFIGGLPNNIQGNGYTRSVENKKRLENNPKDNHGQQPVFKWQNVRGQNMARAYTAGNNKKRGYVGSLPYCKKCKLHHAGPCTVRCGNCKRVSHMTRDCKAGTFRKDCPKLRNQKYGNKTENLTGGNEAIAKAYAIGGGGANLDSNIVTGTFFLNNCYASMLFDSGADRSFVSSTFSALLEVVPSTLDTSYALAKYYALIVCDEKVVRIPYGDEVLIIRGDDCDGRTVKDPHHLVSRAMVLMVERNHGEHLIHRFAGRGNKPDSHDVKIASLKQRIQELEFSQLQQDSPVEKTETKSNVWDDGSEDVNQPIMFVEDESCPVYDTDNEEEESMPVYDTDIEDVIEEEE
ncbi:putative reverse transcriptase domain-containing protein, partial [Tanacetum coccineum]